MKAKRITAFISAILMCSSMVSVNITGASAEEAASEEMISEEVTSEETASEDETTEETIPDLKMSETITSFAPFLDLWGDHQKEVNTALSYKNDVLNGGFFGYSITSEEILEGINRCPSYILYLVDEYSYLDTFEIDEGYTIDDILQLNGIMGTNHFKATGNWYGFKWVYDHGVLTISGEGDIPAPYATHKFTGTGFNHERYPWSNFQYVSEVIFEDGVKDIPWHFLEFSSQYTEKIVLGSDAVIRTDSFGLYGSGRGSVDVYCSETTQIDWNYLQFICDKGNIIIHGYTNSPVYYAVQKLQEESSEYDGDCVNDRGIIVKFESVGTAEGDYSDYAHKISGECKEEIEYILDISTGTLSAIWDDIDQTDFFINTEHILEELTVTNGEIDYDNYSWRDYVKKLEIQDGLKTVNKLKGLDNLEVIVVPDSVEKLPDIRLLPADTSKLTIVANTGTYAEEYAKEKGINFVDAKDYSGEITFSKTDLNNQSEETTETDITTDSTTEPSTTQEIKLGDANLDGEINIADAVFINKYLVDAVQLSDESRTASDCDKDGSVTSADALVILKYLVGTIDTIE